MSSHERKLGPIERAGLEENAVRNRDFAQVVEQAAQADSLECLFVHAHPSRDTDRPVRDPV